MRALQLAGTLGRVTAAAIVVGILVAAALAGTDPRPPANEGRPTWCPDDWVCRSIEQERQQQHVVSDLIAALDECRAAGVKRWGACYGLGVSIGLDPDNRCEGAHCSSAYTWQVMPAASFIWGRRPP